MDILLYTCNWKAVNEILFTLMRLNSVLVVNSLTDTVSQESITQMMKKRTLRNLTN